MLTSIQGTGKNQLEPSQESIGVVPALSYSSVLRNVYQNRPVCWSIVVKEKSTVGSPFFGAFPSDRILSAAKDVNVNVFIHCSNFCELYQQIPVNYTREFWKIVEATAYYSVSYTFSLTTGNSMFIRKYCEGYALMCFP
jgi:hypothetical protein